MQRKISTKIITKKIAELVRQTALYLRKDVENFYINAYKKEKNPQAKLVLEKLLENSKLAKKKAIPYCQDTGLEIIFCEIGQNVQIIDGELEKAIQTGVALGSKKGFLRASIVADPILRENTKTNTPAIIHYKIVLGNSLKFSCIAKGFGSENKSAVCMMNPTASIDEIKNFIIEAVKKAGTNACPPFLIGIGLGGTIDKACELAKEALLIPLYERNKKPHLAKLEKDLLKDINDLQIGPLGFGGDLTAIDVHIKEYACHIAGLPVAVNIGCHAVRTGSLEL